ncbi:MAG: RraA family protein [Microcella sp.]|uniref:RraA family protein n=1 Tax=Microcella sp. TaxID=1913979 RepID=UPI003315577B
MIDLSEVREKLTSPLLSDTLDGFGFTRQCLDTGLAALTMGTVMAGWAFPVRIERVYAVPTEPFRGLLTALDAIGFDEVFITPTHRARDIAVWGELLTSAAIARGAAGALTDGLIRDTAAIRALSFPVFSAGTIPLDSKGRHEVVEHGVPVVIDGIPIEPGDLVFADGDGVVIVPQAVARDVIREALKKRNTERQFLESVADGMLTTDAYKKFGVL